MEPTQMLPPRLIILGLQKLQCLLLCLKCHLKVCRVHSVTESCSVLILHQNRSANQDCLPTLIDRTDRQVTKVSLHHLYIVPRKHASLKRSVCPSRCRSHPCLEQALGCPSLHATSNDPPELLRVPVPENRCVHASLHYPRPGSCILPTRHKHMPMPPRHLWVEVACSAKCLTHVVSPDQGFGVIQSNPQLSRGPGNHPHLSQDVVTDTQWEVSKLQGSPQALHSLPVTVSTARWKVQSHSRPGEE